jgi:dihydrodipicolinate reductase
MKTEPTYSIIGYGRMGHLTKEVLGDKDKRIGEIIDPNYGNKEWKPDSLENTDIAIVFVSPDAGYEVTKRVLKKRVNAVVGTTKFYLNPDGTLNQKMLDELGEIAKENNVRFVYAQNFSPAVNKFVAELREEAPFYSKNGYRPVVIEVHHTGKIKDVSGTAVGSIGPALLEAYSDKEGLAFSINEAVWPERDYGEKFDSSLLDAPFDSSVKGTSADKIREQVASAEEQNKIPIVAIRYGDIPGRHRVNFIGETDTAIKDSVVTDRKIFAAGAVKISEQLFDLEPGPYCITDLI